jgi:hypothetical protein
MCLAGYVGMTRPLSKTQRGRSVVVTQVLVGEADRRSIMLFFVLLFAFVMISALRASSSEEPGRAVSAAVIKSSNIVHDRQIIAGRKIS